MKIRSNHFIPFRKKCCTIPGRLFMAFVINTLAGHVTDNTTEHILNINSTK